MKKSIFTLVIALCGLMSVSAQEVGQWWVGGSVGIWSSKVKGADESTLTYRVLPEIGYVVSDNIGIGMSFGYIHDERIESRINESNAVVDYKEKMDAFTVAPFVRVSFLKGDLGSLFIDAGGSYTQGKEKESKLKTTVIEAGIRPGVAVDISDNISLIGKFGFIGYQNTKVGETKANSFGLDINMDQFLLGACLKF